MPFADLGLTADRDLPIQWTESLITGDALIRQRIESRLRLFLGEWILDATQGMPFVDWVQTKPPPLVEIRLKTESEILGVPGVTAFDEVEIDFDLSTRRVTISGIVTTEDDERVGTTVQLLGQGANKSPIAIFFGQSGGIATGGGGL